MAKKAKLAKNEPAVSDDQRNVYPDDGRTHAVGEEPCWCNPEELHGQRIHKPYKAV